jgi:hypothetical protein
MTTNRLESHISRFEVPPSRYCAENVRGYVRFWPGKRRRPHSDTFRVTRNEVRCITIASVEMLLPKPSLMPPGASVEQGRRGVRLRYLSARQAAVVAATMGPEGHLAETQPKCSPFAGQLLATLAAMAGPGYRIGPPYPHLDMATSRQLPLRPS